MNTFGELFKVTTFGESHGTALGAVIDGCPAGVALTREQVQVALDRRRPGQSAVTTARGELDVVEILSGVYEAKTLGTPIAAIVRNHDARSQDYAKLTTDDRPGHADRVWRERFKHRDPRGGGRTSGRETLSRVIGGFDCRSLPRPRDSSALGGGLGVTGRSAVGSAPEREADSSRGRCAGHRCPDEETATAMKELIVEAKAQGDSLRRLDSPSHFGRSSRAR